MRRRSFLKAGGIALGTGLAACARRRRRLLLSVELAPDSGGSHSELTIANFPTRSTAWRAKLDIECGRRGLIIGFVNDGIAAVPGVLRVSVVSSDGEVNVGGCLDAGYPLPGKVRQAKLALPKGTKWQGLRLKAEIEVKGQRYPVRWACRQKLNEDGGLTLRQTVGLGAEDETGGVPRGPE